MQKKQLPQIYLKTQNTSKNGTPRNNSFAQIQKLKRIENDVETMRRRLSVLKIQQQKNARKSQLALKKIKYHQMIQDLQNKAKQQQKINRYYQQLNRSRQQNINSANRSQRSLNLKQIKQSLKNARSIMYKNQKDFSEQINNKIIKQNQNDYLEKKKYYINVKQNQNKSKKNYQMFYLSKRSSIQKYKEGECTRIMELQAKRQKQAVQLANMEMEMIKRNSTSFQSAQKTHQKLLQVLNINKSIKSSKQRTNKLQNKQINPQSW